MEQVSVQLFLFLVLVVSGMIMGIVFDFFRVLRGRRRFSKLIRFVLDILFWLFIFLFFTSVLLASNWGEVRGYVFLFTGFGIFVYYMWISKSFIGGYVVFFTVSERIASKVISIFIKIIVILIFPIELVFNILKKIIYKFRNFVINIINNLLLKIKELINKHKKQE